MDLISILYHFNCAHEPVYIRNIVCLIAGAYISGNSTHHYLPGWAHLRQKSGQNAGKEWSEHKIKAEGYRLAEFQNYRLIIIETTDMCEAKLDSLYQMTNRHYQT